MTIQTEEESWSTWFLVALFVVAVVVLLAALFLWLRPTPDAGRLAGMATATAPAVAGTATSAPVARRTAGLPLPSPTFEAAPTATVVAGPAATVVPPAPATTTASPGATATATASTAPRALSTGEAMGTIEGEVALEGREHFSGIALLVDGTWAATTDASGAFRLAVPAGHHRVGARYPAYMSIEAADVEVRAGQVTRLPAVSLKAGDTDGDGDVDLFDVVRCVINLGQPAVPGDTHADINGDGVVDLRDVILTQRNYRGTGPAPWY